MLYKRYNNRVFYKGVYILSTFSTIFYHLLLFININHILMMIEKDDSTPIVDSKIFNYFILN